MRLIVERDALHAAWSIVARALPKYTHLPALAGVRVDVTDEGLVLTGSDLETTITATVEEAEADVDGALVLPGRLVRDLLAATPAGPVTIAAGDGWQATIEAGGARAEVFGFDPGDWPKLRQPAGERLAVGRATLANTAAAAASWASTDTTRPITGVLFEPVEHGLRIIATDSYRLIVFELPGATFAGVPVIVPRTAIEHLRHLPDDGNVSVQLADGMARFDVGTASLTTTLIEGAYPPYRNLVPGARLANVLTVRPKDVVDALRAAMVFNEETKTTSRTTVRLHLAPAGCRVASTSGERGRFEQAVDGTYDGAAMTFGVNASHFGEMLEVFGADEVAVEFTDQLKPCVVRSGSNVAVLMLVRFS